MIGLGYAAEDMGDFSYFQGIQLSLFDNSDTTNLARIDNHILGVRGSYSDATGNHKAFFADADTMTFGFPLVMLEHRNPETEPWAYGDVLSFSGAVIYGLSEENDSLVEKGRVSHTNLIHWNANRNYSRDAGGRKQGLHGCE